MKSSVVVLSVGVLVLCGIVTRVGAHAPQSPAPRPPLPLRMTAWAVNMSNIATGANATVEINVTRWATGAERTALITTFLEKGQDALLSALQKSTAHGRMRYPGVTARTRRTCGSVTTCATRGTCPCRRVAIAS